MLPKLLVLAAAVLAAVTAAAAFAGDPPEIDHARDATAQFHRFAVAKDAGYGLLTDAKGIACIDMPGMGAMGIHYVDGDLVGDPAVLPSKPEALMYEPEANGRLRLVALEYVTFKDAWDKTHSSPPSLFGRQFNFTPEPNRYGLPAFYSLHAWIWKHNHDGTFAMWNHDVTCANA